MPTALDLKYLIRAFLPSRSLRIQLSHKSMEKAFIEVVGAENEELIQQFEQDIFGYRIDRPANALSGAKAGSVAYNLPVKSMVGRSVKTAEEAVEHFNKNNIELQKVGKRSMKPEVTKQMRQKKKEWNVANDERHSKTLKELVDAELESKVPLKTLIDVTAEVKYDGERTQIHYKDGTVNLFSRNHKIQNQKFWLLKDRLELYFKNQSDQAAYSPHRWQGLDSFILDGEVVFADE
eukprot:CAMPEP_0170481522 /NCGR_PEP_ID=MMETSP0208-20121228/1937_1 /TAXON_ID=197538 /ORGANISM="Strombidium inclinatum, Strain S3" /LENGTH=234 /DNA_ID=CAMNT_0010754243 /DNA_START=654 /DNA_END=1358 /DNA_ORIENTATION=-